MPLTPEDVSNKRFTPVRLREGYDMGEVDQFLDEVESELDRLTAENDELRAKLAAAQSGSASFEPAPTQLTAIREEPVPAPPAPEAPAPVVEPPAPAPVPVAAPVETPSGGVERIRVETVPEAS